MQCQIGVISGDGIGPEIVTEAKKVLDRIGEKYNHQFHYTEILMGGCSIEMIYALDKIAPGTANDDTLLYGVEVKFYNMEVEIDEHLQSKYDGLYIIGDGSGVTHSLSHASASGVYVARHIAENMQ